MGGSVGGQQTGDQTFVGTLFEVIDDTMCKLSMVKKRFVLKTTKVCERSPEISQHFRFFYCTISLYIWTRYLDVAMRYLDVTKGVG